MMHNKRDLAFLFSTFFFHYNNAYMLTILVWHDFVSHLVISTKHKVKLQYKSHENVISFEAYMILNY